jgi:archaellum component FlaF (FlaF/FlaG flagellin family)
MQTGTVDQGVSEMMKMMGAVDPSTQLVGAPNGGTPTVPPVTPQTPAPPNAPAQQQTPTTPQAPAAQQAAAPQNPNVIETPLGNIVLNNPAAAPVEIKSYEDAFGNPVVVNTFGMPVTTPKDFVEKVIPKVNEWRGAASKLGELETRYNNLVESVNMMPPELKGVVQQFYEDAKEGTENWKAMIATGPVVDYRKPVTEVPKETLINSFFPGKFTAEELMDGENKSVQIAYESARDKYVSVQNQKREAAKRKVDSEAQRLKNVSASIESSVSALGTNLPIAAFDDGRKGQIKTMMEDGTWVSQFLNEDGSYKPDAAQKIAFALHGPQTLESVMQVVQAKVTGQMNEQIVDKGMVTQVAGPGTDMMDQAQAARKKAENDLVSLMTTKKPTL